ncbi:gp58-like family protein [Latilactobacillus sakei]|uniref:gp58-like family protein n=1 Tax=Latilactobacillus sakei TaxID=1599 RepID=UPI003884FD2B
MLKVSDAFNSAFAAPDRELRARVTIGKTVYDSDDLTSINYDSGAMTGEQFSIGSTYMNSAKIIFSHLVEGLKQLDEVLVELGVLKPDGTVEYVKMGTFIVDDKIQMDRNNNTTTIECMDRMTMLGGTYVSKLTYPARIKDVAIEIANMAGVKANETSFARLSENKINQPTGYTYRDAIGLIAQFQMGFALFDRDGLLDIRTLQDNSFKIDPNQYFLKGLVKNETFFKLNGISCTVVTTSKDENGNETSKTTVLQSGSSSGAQIKLANNVMTQDVLDRMYEALKFTNYYPFSLNWNGNPAVEAGDWLTVEDLQGNEFKVPNMSYTLTYNGGLTTTSKADTSVSSPATYSYGGSMSNIVNEIGGREGAEGNHIYEGTEDQKPLFPKEGDLWYKHVGPDTEEWIYKDGKWEFLTSTKTANDAADAADKASKEAEEAKKQANKAVDGANDAVAKAGFANDTANQAKSDAAAAGQQAKDALTSAGTALTDAKKALTNSSSAQADSAQARKDSATAAADAATALTDAKKALTDSGSAMVDSAQARKDSATAIKDAADSLTSAKDALNKVGNLTTSVTSQFTTVDNELKSKVNQTDYDKLKGTVTSQQTEINQNASEIKLKADKSYADTINNSVVKNTSSIGLLNNQIALTVSKAELNNTLSSYATQTWTQGQIKTTADQINLSVTKVDSKIENLTTGAPNLLRNTSKFANGDHWGHNGSLTINKHVYWKNGSEPMFVLSNNTTTEVTLSSERVALEAGADYTIQFDAFANYFFTNGDVFLLSRKYGSSNAYDTITLVMDRFKLSNDGTKHLQTTFKVPTGMDEGYIRFDNNSSSTAGKKADMWITNIKFAKENKPSPYAPAPEDLVTDVEFAELGVKVDGITATVASKADKTQITQLSDQIKLKADTTAVTTLKGTVDKQGSEITLNTNSIKLKADQSSVDTLKGTVDKQGSAIDVNTKAIALKANQSTVDTLTGRVSTAEGKITVQADQITQTVSKTELTNILGDYATQTWTQSQIKSTADQINLSVVSLKTEVENNGAENLIQNSSFKLGKAGWSGWEGPYIHDPVVETYHSKPYTAVYFGQNKQPYADLIHDGKIPLTPSTSYVFQIKTRSLIKNHAVTYIQECSSDGKVINDHAFIINVNSPDYITNVQKFTTSAAAEYAVLRIRAQPGDQFMASELMLTEGTLAPKNWYPSSVDNATTADFASLEITIKGIQSTVTTKADQSQVTQLAGQITSVVGDVSANSSQITQMKADINLRVQKSDVVNQINISPEGILIDGQKVHITGLTRIDNAVIKDAMIADIKADKITAGTLNAANVNVINFNANNITTGTIKGANLSMNLNTGEVVFQHGRIHSSSNNIDINVDQGYISTANLQARAILKNGELQLVEPTFFDTSTDPYLQISNGMGAGSWNGANIIGRDYIMLSNRANSGGFLIDPIDKPEDFAGIAVGKSDTGGWQPTKIGGATRGVKIRGGTAFKTPYMMFKSSPEILVGNGPNGADDRIRLSGNYIHILSAYEHTASGSANLIVARDGALVRSTSASKYKTDIIRTNTPDYGEKLLELPTATWTDIAETKRYRDDPATQMKPTRNFGMIAEDLADAGLEMLVVRGTDGELEGINYDRIGPALIPVIAKLKNEVEILKRKLEEKTA